jgi:hypothetical protein
VLHVGIAPSRFLTTGIFPGYGYAKLRKVGQIFPFIADPASRRIAAQTFSSMGIFFHEIKILTGLRVICSPWIERVRSRFENTSANTVPQYL